MRMRRMYENEGLSRDEIARQLGRSPSTVGDTLKGLGVQMRSVGGSHKGLRRLPIEEVNRTVEMYADGKSHREIAREIGRNRSTVARRLARAGVTGRDGSRAQLVRWRGLEALGTPERCSRTVPGPPLARLIAKTVGKDGELGLALQSGVSDKLLRRLRQGAEYIEWTSADKILTALGALWFDAYHEDDPGYEEAAAVWEAA